MGSCTSPLDHAFDAVWAGVVAADPFRDLDRDEMLEDVIKEKIAGFAHQGVTDETTLCELTLRSIGLDPHALRYADMPAIPTLSSLGHRA